MENHHRALALLALTLLALALLVLALLALTPCVCAGRCAGC